MAAAFRGLNYYLNICSRYRSDSELPMTLPPAFSIFGSLELQNEPILEAAKCADVYRDVGAGLLTRVSATAGPK